MSLTPEQKLAFNMSGFNGLPVESVITEGEKMLPANLRSDPEIIALFEDVRARCQGLESSLQGSVFNPNFAAVLIELGLLTPEFFFVLMRKIRFEAFKKNMMTFLRQIKHGKYVQDFFEQEMASDRPKRDIHVLFSDKLFPKIIEVFSTLRMDVYPDITELNGKIRLVEKISNHLRKLQLKKVFPQWDEEALVQLPQVFECLKNGLEKALKQVMLSDLVDQNLLLGDELDFEQEERLDAFLRQIQDEFGNSDFDPGHGWNDDDQEGEDWKN